MGRTLLTDPDFPTKAAEGRLEDIRPCIRCRVCVDIYLYIKRSAVHCQVNAALGREREIELKPTTFKKKVLEVGGGPAGMEAARVAAFRGHEVTLHEKESGLGGQMALATLPPFKTPIQDFQNYLIGQLRKLNVKVEGVLSVSLRREGLEHVGSDPGLWSIDQETVTLLGRVYQCIMVIPGKPTFGIFEQFRGVFLKGRQVMERVDAVESAGVNEAHE